MDPERIKIFLDELKTHGFVRRAASRATPSSRLGAVSTFYEERDRNPQFEKDWAAAVEEAKERIEEEVYRRGQTGWDEAQYTKEGVKTGDIKRYSDKLLGMRLSRFHPEYNSKIQIDQKTEVSGAVSLDSLRSLPPEDRDAILEILKRSMGQQETSTQEDG